MIRCPALSLLPLFTAGLAAQAPLDATRGPLSQIPFALSTFRTTGSQAEDILLKFTGDQDAAPIGMPAFPYPAAVPVYRLDVMFAAMSAAQRALIDIDAFSTGNDRLQYDTNGIVDPDFLGGWTQLVFSVKPGATGTGGIMSNRVANAMQVEGDLYSYIFPGSIGVEDNLIDVVHLEIPGDAMDIGSDDLQAGDVFLSQILMNQGATSNLVTTANKFYFSLTNASAIALTASGALGITWSGGTVYELTWSTSTASWSAPTAAWSATTLGLAANEDLDALLVNATTGKLVVSTDQTNRNQIVAYVAGGVPALKPLLVGTNDPVTGRIKLNGTDDIDVLCCADPDANVYNQNIGTPIDLDGAHPTRLLGISTARHMAKVPPFAGTTLYDVGVTGWGMNMAGPGMLYLYVAEVVNGRTRNATMMGARSRTASQGKVVFTFDANGIAAIDFAAAAFWVPTAGINSWSYGSALGF